MIDDVERRILEYKMSVVPPRKYDCRKCSHNERIDDSFGFVFYACAELPPSCQTRNDRKRYCDGRYFKPKMNVIEIHKR